MRENKEGWGLKCNLLSRGGENRFLVPWCQTSKTQNCTFNTFDAPCLLNGPVICEKFNFSSKSQDKSYNIIKTPRLIILVATEDSFSSVTDNDSRFFK